MLQCNPLIEFEYESRPLMRIKMACVCPQVSFLPYSSVTLTIDIEAKTGLHGANLVPHLTGDCTAVVLLGYRGHLHIAAVLARNLPVVPIPPVCDKKSSNENIDETR